jgi:hypothetical protein
MIYRICCAAAVCGVLIGCGKEAPYTGETRFPLKGKVTFNGQPLDGATISFIPQDENARPAGGPIVNGEYSVRAEQGGNKGNYRVEIRWLTPTGKKRHDDDTGEEVDIVEEALPRKFNDASELKADVGPDKTEFNFDLKP